MNRIDTPFPLTKEEYKILETLIKNDYSQIRFFDRKKMGKNYVSFTVNYFKKIEPLSLRKLRKINQTVKCRYYWCDKDSEFVYFYELNKDNNWTDKDYQLIRRLNEEKLTINYA